MTEPRTRGGRPPSAPEAKRKQYDVRLTDAEWTEIEHAAREAAPPPRIWMRLALLQAARKS